jgi:surfeit locus 1 family protein
MFAIRANIPELQRKFRPLPKTTTIGKPRAMNTSKTFLRQARGFKPRRGISRDCWTPIAPKCPSCRHISQSTRRSKAEPADDPNFMSIVDNPPNLVRAGRRHGPGLIVLGKLP